MRRILFSLPLFLVALSSLSRLNAAPVPGDRLPAISLVSTAGGTKSVWSKGRITVVAFCAFWCDTWKEQNQRMTAARQSLQGLPVTWTMVSVDGRWGDKGRDKAAGNVARDALLDVGGRWTNRLDIRSVPTTLVLDGSGKVCYAGQGIARSQTLLKVVRGIMGGKATTTQSLHLVFDDFPSRDARLDDRLLDTLRAARVRATFCGDETRRDASPAIVRRARAEGHQLRDAFGTPPRGVIDPFDWKRPGRAELERRILCAIAPGKTVLLHAGVRDTVEALPYLLDSLRRRSVQFVW